MKAKLLTSILAGSLVLPLVSNADNNYVNPVKKVADYNMEKQIPERFPVKFIGLDKKESNVREIDVYNWSGNFEKQKVCFQVIDIIPNKKLDYLEYLVVNDCNKIDKQFDYVFRYNGNLIISKSIHDGKKLTKENAYLTNEFVENLFKAMLFEIDGKLKT